MYKRPSYLIAAVAHALASLPLAARLVKEGDTLVPRDPNREAISAGFARMSRTQYLRLRSINYRVLGHAEPERISDPIQREIVAAACAKRARRGLKLCAEGR